MVPTKCTSKLEIIPRCKDVSIKPDVPAHMEIQVYQKASRSGLIDPKIENVTVTEDLSAVIKPLIGLDYFWMSIFTLGVSLKPAWNRFMQMSVY